MKKKKNYFIIIISADPFGSFCYRLTRLWHMKLTLLMILSVPQNTTPCIHSGLS